jgi:hypothetical protein
MKSITFKPLYIAPCEPSAERNVELKQSIARADFEKAHHAGAG